MITRRLLLISVIGAAGIVASCGSNIKRFPEYRYRLTVEVETPEGLKTGSSVIEVRTLMKRERGFLDEGAVSAKARGQAVTVDLGKRGLMFALLRSESSKGLAENALFGASPVVPNSAVEGAENPGLVRFEKRVMGMLAMKGVRDLPRHDASSRRKYAPEDPATAYPVMVRFRDLNDPSTIEKVDPDNLAVAFGAGVKLKRITVERTEDPVTTGLANTLKWLPTHAGKLDSSGDINFPHPEPEKNYIPYDFDRGVTR